MRGNLLILLGAIITFIPVIYWRFTAGNESLYAESSFFPHYLVMILLAVLAATVNCLIGKKFFETQVYHWLSCISGAVILWTYVSIMVLITCYKQGDFEAWFFIIILCGAVIWVYEAILLLIHLGINKILKKL